MLLYACMLTYKESKVKQLSANQIKDIIDLYTSGTSPKEIGIKHNIRNNSVTRIIRKNGIERNQLERLSQDKIDKIISEYIEGISSEVIANKLGINGSTVCRQLIKNGVTIRPATQNKRKYESLIENYFETINTEEKAYFLGLLYADGSLSKLGNDIKITLHEKDKDILEKFSIVTYGFIRKMAEEIRTYESGTVSRYLTVSMYSQKMHDDLVKLGCGPVKTFTIRFPSKSIVPSNLLNHFVRGYFDGDGCVSKSNPSSPVVDFTSNLIFIEKIAEYLTENNLRCEKVCQSKENPLSGNVQLKCPDNIINFYNIIYKDATIFMQRKYNTFQELFKFLKDKRTAKLEKMSDITRYGTSYIPEYNGKILTSENIKQMSDIEKTESVDYLFRIYRENGFPYPQLTDNELIADFTSLKNIDAPIIDRDKMLMTHRQSGILIFKHFSPHFFEVNSGAKNHKLSMLDTFNDDKLLKKVIKNRLDGNHVMTGNMIRQGLANSKIAYKSSTYSPIVAKFIYTKFTNPDDIIYDYSMGFGQRLTAALSLPYKITYIGIDPVQKTVDSNKNIYSFLNRIPMLNKDVNINCIVSEPYSDPRYEGKVTLAFSCPPYFNIEKYDDNPGQAYFNINYLDFISVWWDQTVKNIYKLLKDDGIFAINVKDKVDGFNLGEDMRNVVVRNGFSLIDTYQVQLTRTTVYGGANGNFKYEPIFIMKK